MIKKIIKHSAIYGVGNVLRNATGFFLLPLYTSYFSVSQYGELEVFIVTISILLSIVQLGFGSALFKYFSYDTIDIEQTAEYNKKIISSSFYFIVSFAGIVMLIGFLFRVPLSKLLFNTPDYNNLLILVFIIVLMQVIHVIPKAYLRIRNKSVVYSAINIGEFLIRIGVTIYLVAVMKIGIKGVLLGFAISTTCFALLYTVISHKMLVPKISFSVIRKMLGYGIYLIPVSIGAMILALASRYFILFYSNSNELGLFALGDKISRLLFIGVMAFQTAWPAIMFRIKERPDAKNQYSRVITYYILAFAGILIALCLFSRELILLFGNTDYLRSAGLIPVLGLGYYIYGLFYAATIGINIFKKTYFQTIAMIVAAGVNLILNFILAPRYGITGVGIAFLGSTITLSILAVSFSQRIYKVPIQRRRIIIVGLGIILTLIPNYTLLKTVSIYHELLKAILLVGFFPLFLFVSGFFSDYEKTAVNRQIALVKNRIFS